jgi:hypothetical protein
MFRVYEPAGQNLPGDNRKAARQGRSLELTR